MVPSYLVNRQHVSIDGNDSEPVVIKHGVSWGSILESLSFILFINNLLFYGLSSQIDLYADDTTLTSSAQYKDTSSFSSYVENVCKKLSQHMK